MVWHAPVCGRSAKGGHRVQWHRYPGQMAALLERRYWASGPRPRCSSWCWKCRRNWGSAWHPHDCLEKNPQRQIRPQITELLCHCEPERQ